MWNSMSNHWNSEVRREGEKDGDHRWYTYEIEQSPTQSTKMRVSTAATGILFRICCISFSPTHCIFFLSFALRNIKHTPTWTSFISHTFASELLSEVLMLNSQTTDSAHHLSLQLISVIIIFWKDLYNHILWENVEPYHPQGVIPNACRHTDTHSCLPIWWLCIVK